MRIGLPIGYLALGTAGGVETYARNLVKALQAVDRSNEYCLYCSIANEEAFPATAENFKKVISGKWKQIELVRLKAVAAADGIIQSGGKSVFMKTLRSVTEFATRGAKVLRGLAIDSTGGSQQHDIIHYMFNVFPHEKHHDALVVLTIADIQQEYFPQFFSKESLEQRRCTYRISAEKSNHIIAISEFTKKSLVELYGISEAKISVTHLGYNDKVFKTISGPEVGEFRARRRLPSKFMLYPAATWPHKNHVNLVRAYKIMKERFGFDEKLIFTGIKKQSHSAVAKEIERLGLKDDIIHIGYLPYEDLPLLYNAASLLVFPSLFEGFGMPVVEAMGVGLPVACSNTTSLPEVAGGAAILFDPEDPEDIAEKVAALLNDKALKKTLVQKGLARASMFTWEQTALKTKKVYEDVYADFRKDTAGSKLELP